MFNGKRREDEKMRTERAVRGGRLKNRGEERREWREKNEDIEERLTKVERE